MNIPVVYRSSQTKSDRINFLIMIGLFSIVVGIVIGITSFNNYDKDVQLNVYSNADPDERIVSGDIYQYENAVVIGNYATTTYEDMPTDYHFVIAYRDDKDTDEGFLASVSLNENYGEFCETMRKYSKSNEVQYITFCAKAEPVSNLDENVYDYYKDYVGYCEEYFDNAVDSGLSLTYCFDYADQFEDYCQKEKNDFKLGVGIAAAFAALGVVLVVLGMIKRGPRQPSKKQLETAREMLKAKGAYDTESEEDERYGYINSDDFFGKSDDYVNQNRE